MAEFKLLHGEDAISGIMARAKYVAELAAVDDFDELSVEKIVGCFAKDRGSLVVSDTDETFAVVQIQTDDSDEDTIFVWLAYAPNRHIHDLFLAYVDHLAVDLGARAVEFCSPRRGWTRVAARHGFKASKPWVTYRKVL